MVVVSVEVFFWACLWWEGARWEWGQDECVRSGTSCVWIEVIYTWAVIWIEADGSLASPQLERGEPIVICFGEEAISSVTTGRLRQETRKIGAKSELVISLDPETFLQH